MPSFRLAALTLAILAAPVGAQFQSVRVQLIDRGQADGILIRTPNQEWVVIDAGTNSQQASAMRDEWGVDEVVLAIVSHRHFDHHGGMDEILNEFPVARFIMRPEDCPDRTSDDRVRTAATDNGVTIEAPSADTITVDGVDFIILPDDPTLDDCPEEENDNSIVVRMEFGAFSMLFAGDAETDEREWLMENHPDLLDAVVLKAAHHGSRNGADGTVVAGPTARRSPRP